MSQPYQKGWLSYADQVQLLQKRGLVVSDLRKAEQFLSHLNYYRFSGYCLAFKSQRHQEEANRSSELFVTHFKQAYIEFPDLPVWMVTEVKSFGGLSKMFMGMSRSDQKSISSRYGLQPSIFQSWMHHFVYVRNLCAHHSRLWDRV